MLCCFSFVWDLDLSVLETKLNLRLRVERELREAILVAYTYSNSDSPELDARSPVLEAY